MLKRLSVTISRRRVLFRSRSRVQCSPIAVADRRGRRPATSRQPSSRLAWFLRSVKTASPGPTKAAIVPEFAANPEAKTKAASVPSKAASRRSNSAWVAECPDTSGLAPLSPSGCIHCRDRGLDDPGIGRQSEVVVGAEMD